MVKFKYFKKSLREIKCLVKKVMMAKPVDDSPDVKSKKSDVNTRNVASSASSAEGFIPLAARDSQWVGIDFYNPHFRSPLDEEDDVEEVELQNLAADGIEAIYLLFPGLAKRNNNILLRDHESPSTTEITKLLVGQKADFRNMRSSKRLILTDSKLTSVPESLQEDRAQSDTDTSQITKKSVTDVESRAMYGDDEDDAPDLVNRIKKRKKKSEMRIVPVVSSTSFVPSSSKTRQCSNTLQSSPSLVSVVDSRFADDETEVKKPKIL